MGEYLIQSGQVSVLALMKLVFSLSLLLVADAWTATLRNFMKRKIKLGS